MQVFRQQLIDAVAVVASGAGALVQVLPRDVVFVLDVTVAGGTTLDVDVEAQDPVSGKWFVIDSFTQVTTSIATERKVFTGLHESNLRVAFVLGVAGPYTFTVSVQGKEGDEA
jgi:hypothetical protein